MYESAVYTPLVPAPPSHQLLTVLLHIIYFLFRWLFCSLI